LEYWEKYHMIGSRIFRGCTDKAKIKPIRAYLRIHAADGDAELLGIDAGESHRAKSHPDDNRPKLYPLVDLGIDRSGCLNILKHAGLPPPVKSGCWHCPFMRVAEVRDLYHKEPEKFARIAELERISFAKRGIKPVGHQGQWSGRTAEEWAARFREEDAQGQLPFGKDPIQMAEIPCGCFDGGDD